MSKSPTIFAKVILSVVTFAALAVCVILLPELAREEMVGKPKSADITIPFLTISYILAAPFFAALFFTYKLLRLIDRNKAFSKQAVNILQNIKICAAIFSILVIITTFGVVTYLRSTNPTDDMPPFFLFGSVLTFISSIIAVFVAVLQRLLTDAVIMKSENDLIV